MICPHCGHDNLPGSDTCANCQGDLTALDRPEPFDRLEEALMHHPVSRLSPRPPDVVGSGATVADAVNLMLASRIGAVLVVDGAGQLAGIFSERDLLTKIIGSDQPINRIPIADFMTPRPETVSADDTLAFALHKMDVGGYRHLPVVDRGRPTGILSVREIIGYITGLCRQ